MILLPFQLLVSLVLGFIALFLLGLSVFFLYRVYRALHQRRVIVRRAPSGSLVAAVAPAATPPPSSLLPFLIPGLLLLIWTFAGKYAVLSSRPAGVDEPRAMHSDTVQTIARPDGARLHVESLGPPGAPTLVFTHGWGLDNAEWYYAKRHLAGRYRLLVWDLPGLGQSTPPDDRNYALDRLADDLGAVVDAAGQPVVLVGHSIGGMINLTFCRRFPDRLGRQILGIVELNTTYTNPVMTSKGAGTNAALQPAYELLLHAMIPLSPLLRALNWLSYQSGLGHMQAASSFAGTETRGQLDFAARYNYISSPAVIARGMLGMLHWDASGVLPGLRAPVLIVAGDQDTTTLPDASVHMQQTIPGSELQVMTPAAHLGPLERNQEYDERIAQFAAKCFTGKSF